MKNRVGNQELNQMKICPSAFPECRQNPLNWANLIYPTEHHYFERKAGEIQGFTAALQRYLSGANHVS